MLEFFFSSKLIIQKHHDALTCAHVFRVKGLNILLDSLKTILTHIKDVPISHLHVSWSNNLIKI